MQYWQNKNPTVVCTMKFEGFSTEREASSPVVYLQTSSQTLPADVLKLSSERKLEKNVYSTVTETFYVYFAALIGAPLDVNDDYDVYRNMLYTLRENLIKSPKFLIYMENGLRKPTPDEVNLFSTVSHSGRDEILAGMKSVIKIAGDPFRENLAKSALETVTADIPTEQLYNICVKLVTWLFRCTKAESFKTMCHEIPLLLYYGNISKHEMLFLQFFSAIGMDVVYISENKQAEEILNEVSSNGHLQIFTLPANNSVTAYPDRLLKVKVATEAYRAQRELDTFLYGNDTFFRDFQFPSMQALTLKTTLDEIDVIWHEQSKFRSGFRTDRDRVTIPNIFAKINGVKNGDIDDYWDEVRLKLSPMSVIVQNSPAYKRGIESSQIRIYQNFINGERILTEKLKNSQYNKFAYLAENIQNNIFEKMQEAADSGLLKLDFSELLPYIIHVGLSLDKKILQILQKFDFTKDIPKFIMVDTIEDTFSKVECIQLVLYNLLGFDILVFTPTGYRNLETFIDDSAFESYNQGEYCYKMPVPRFRIPDKIPERDNGGFFGKLFKR
jgi:hypothetical protein